MKFLQICGQYFALDVVAHVEPKVLVSIVDSEPKHIFVVTLKASEGKTPAVIYADPEDFEYWRSLIHDQLCGGSEQ